MRCSPPNRKMNLFALWTCILLTIISFGRTSAFAFHEAEILIKIAYEISQEITEVWDAYSSRYEQIPATKAKFPLNYDKTDLILERVHSVLNRVEKLDDTLEMSIAELRRDVVNDIGHLLRWEMSTHKLMDMIDTIWDAAETMTTYSADHTPFNENTIRDFAESVVSHHPGSVRSLMNRIHFKISPHDHSKRLPLLYQPGIFDHVLQASKAESTGGCLVRESPQQLIYNVYGLLATTQLKGYAMIQFSWMLLHLYNHSEKNTSYEHEARKMTETFSSRTILQAEAAMRTMQEASREFYRCDPAEHIFNKTYLTFTNFLQGYIENEVDLNNEGSCRENCPYYTYAKSYGCYAKGYCSKMPRCKGRIVNCRFVESDMHLCFSNPQDKTRLYDYIEYASGKVYGESKKTLSRGSCPNRKHQVNSWWRWIFWHCSYCLCLCDEQGPHSDRYFNLRAVQADVDSNMVITGVRFVKLARVIHVQVQQAHLLPYGGVNASTLHWKPVDVYDITKGVNGDDYHTLTWESRAVDLDDLQVPTEHVLTGIRFRRVGTHLNAEILASPFNFEDGTLIKPLEKSIWLGNDNTDASLDKPRSRLDLPNPGVPTQKNKNSKVLSKPDQFLLVTHSDLTQDVGQTAVPFLDAQPVAPEPPSALAGFGVYHKGTKNSGGFLGLKIFTYDMAPHVRSFAKVADPTPPTNFTIIENRK